MAAGKQLHSLSDLMVATKNKRAVVIPGTVWSKPKPAAIIIHLPAVIVLQLLHRGIFLYEKES